LNIVSSLNVSLSVEILEKREEAWRMDIEGGYLRE
jgi:hypothetical protein